MSTIDDLMLLAYEYADEYADMTACDDDRADTRQTTAARKNLRAALESALRAEYERGQRERGDARRHFVCLCPDCARGRGAREQDAQPAAWCHESALQMLAETGFCHAELTTKARPGKTPLYSKPPKRKPLPVERVNQIINASRESDEGPTALVRRTERAHGIGDE